MTNTSNSRPILVIIGPSGAGKSSAVQQLVRDGLVIVNPTWTTRPARPGEDKASVEHVFVIDEVFDAEEAKGRFLETAKMFGLPYRYGTPPLEPTTDTHVSLVMMRVSVMDRFDTHYPNRLVYQIEDEKNRVQERLVSRGEPLGTRLRDFETEVALGRQLASRCFINTDGLSSLVEQLKQAIDADFGIS